MHNKKMVDLENKGGCHITIFTMVQSDGEYQPDKK